MSKVVEAETLSLMIEAHVNSISKGWAAGMDESSVISTSIMVVANGANVRCGLKNVNCTSSEEIPFDGINRPLSK